jgi:hypothetical protein
MNIELNSFPAYPHYPPMYCEMYGELMGKEYTLGIELFRFMSQR